jgi:hypothetical protein
MDDFERGFTQELEKIAQGGGLHELMRQYGIRPEHLIGGGLGAAAGGVGGYYGVKKLTDSEAGGAAGAALGALGGGALGAAGGGALGKALRTPVGHGPRREMAEGVPAASQRFTDPGTIAPLEEIPPAPAGPSPDMRRGMARRGLDLPQPDMTISLDEVLQAEKPDMDISLDDIQQYMKGLKKGPTHRQQLLQLAKQTLPETPSAGIST